MFPKEILNVIENLPMEEITDYHCSKDKVYNISNKYILKVSSNIERLEKEYNKDTWISNYINSPHPILFIKKKSTAFYLREFLDGDNLCIDKYISNPELLINLLVDAVNILHNVKVTDPKYIINDNYKTLIHGDLCLPNILAKDDKIVGFIDLGDSGIGDPWMDYAWCIWSLEYNLKTNKYTPILLEKLGILFDEEKFNEYTK